MRWTLIVSRDSRRGGRLHGGDAEPAQIEGTVNAIAMAAKPATSVMLANPRTTPPRGGSRYDTATRMRRTASSDGSVAEDGGGEWSALLERRLAEIDGTQLWLRAVARRVVDARP